MANTETVNININANSDNALKSVKDMRLEIKALTIQMSEAGAAGDKVTYDKLKGTIGRLKNDMSDLNATMKASDPGELLTNFTKMGQGAVGAFAAVSGAMSIFGNDSEAIQEIEKKSATIIQTMIGLESFRATFIDQAGKAKIKASFIELANYTKEISASITKSIVITAETTATGTLTKAQRLYNIVVAQNPIVWIIIAVAALTAGTYFLIKALNSETEAQKNVRLANESVNKSMAEGLTTTTATAIKLNAYVKIATDTTIKEKDRNTALKELNTAMGTHYKLTSDLTTITAAYIKSLEATAMAEAIIKSLAEEKNKVLLAEINMTKDKGEAVRLTMLVQKEFNETGKIQTQTSKDQADAQNKFTISLADYDKQLTESTPLISALTATLTPLITQTNAQKTATDAATKATEDATKATALAVDYQKRINEIRLSLMIEGSEKERAIVEDKYQTDLKSLNKSSSLYNALSIALTDKRNSDLRKINQKAYAAELQLINENFTSEYTNSNVYYTAMLNARRKYNEAVVNNAKAEDQTIAKAAAETASAAAKSRLAKLRDEKEDLAIEMNESNSKIYSLRDSYNNLQDLIWKNYPGNTAPNEFKDKLVADALAIKKAEAAHQLISESVLSKNMDIAQEEKKLLTNKAIITEIALKEDTHVLDNYLKAKESAEKRYGQTSINEEVKTNTDRLAIEIAGLNIKKDATLDLTEKTNIERLIAEKTYEKDKAEILNQQENNDIKAIENASDIRAKAQAEITADLMAGGKLTREERTKLLTEAETAVENSNNNILAINKNLDTKLVNVTADTQEKLKNIDKNAAQDKLNSQLDLYKRIAENNKNNLDNKITIIGIEADLDKENAITTIADAQTLSDTLEQIDIKRLHDIRELKRAAFQENLAFTKEAAQAMADITASFKQIEQENLDLETEQADTKRSDAQSAETDRITNEYNNRIAIAKAAGQSIVALEAQKNIALDNLGKDQAEANKKATAKSLEDQKNLKKKYAGLDLAMTLSKITINVAEALSKEWAQMGVYAVIANIATIAAGVIEAGVATNAYNNIMKLGRGGILNGPSHAAGGISVGNGQEVEGGEGVINAASMRNPTLRNMASAINVAGGGVPFVNVSNSPAIVSTLDPSIIDQIVARITAIPVVVVESDITTSQRKVQVIQSKVTLG